MKRRTVLLSALGAGAALVIGWSALPPRQRLERRTPLATGAGESALTGWLKIAADGSVIVMTPKSEMGQGVHTALAMILADELDADWRRVRVEHPSADPIYFNQAAVADGLPFHPEGAGVVKTVAVWMTNKAMREIGLLMTGGSSSVKDLWLPLREAGAAARAMLVDAAAERFGVPAGELVVKAGVIAHAASGRSAGFGELAEPASKRALPRRVALKEPARFALIGKDTPRLAAEAAAKTEGRAGFGIDTVLPGLRYATVRMCPVLGGGVKSFDGQAASALPGVFKVIAVEGFNGGTAGVAVIADTPWHALKAVAAVKVEWDEARGATSAVSLDSATMMDRLAQTLDADDGFGYFSAGDVDAALKGAAKVIRAEYRAPPLAHFALEPINATVQFKDGKATVWASTQVPGLAAMSAAKALGIDADAVTVNVTFLGGGFGRRLEVDFIGQAAAIAKHGDGAPVQTFWSRAEDTTHDLYRPPCVARFECGLDAQGAVVGWRAASAGPSIVHQVLERYFGVAGAGPDKTTAEGSYDQPYEWPAARIGHVITATPLPVGFWRSVGHSHQAFFKESFVDEAAHAAGADPVAFRLALLKNRPRHAAVLKRCAALAKWGTPPQLPAATPAGARAGRGVALHVSFGSIVAQVAEVTVAADGAIRVTRVFAAIDCGTAVNPNHIRQQMESSVVFGLSAALHGGITIEQGRVKQTNFHDQPVLRFDACPAIETVVMPSTAHPEGVGEPGTPPIAPAVANAVFAATGKRLRSLPLVLA